MLLHILSKPLFSVIVPTFRANGSVSNGFWAAANVKGSPSPIALNLTDMRRSCCLSTIPCTYMSRSRRFRHHVYTSHPSHAGLNSLSSFHSWAWPLSSFSIMFPVIQNTFLNGGFRSRNICQAGVCSIPESKGARWKRIFQLIPSQSKNGEHVATAWVDDMNDQSNETVRDAFCRARPFSLKPMSRPDSRAWRTTSHQCSFSLLCSEAASSVVLGKVIVISSSDEKIHDL